MYVPFLIDRVLELFNLVDLLYEIYNRVFNNSYVYDTYVFSMGGQNGLEWLLDYTLYESNAVFLLLLSLPGMKSLVTGNGDFGTDILKIEFGWPDDHPHYAKFQEFGTRTGITPMMAVLDAYNATVVELQARLR